MPPRKACDICSKRKIRCLLPSSGPPCDWCESQKLECTFLRESQSSNRLSSTDVQNLLRRVQQLENELTTTGVRTASHSSITSVGLSPCSEGIKEPSQSLSSPALDREVTQAYFSVSPSTRTESSHPVHTNGCGTGNTAERWLGHNWFFRGIPLLSESGERWVASRIGKPFAFQHFTLFKSKPISQAPAVVENETIKLPNQSETQQLAKLYFQSSTYQTCPILEPVLFERTIQEAHRSGSITAVHQPAAACVLAFHGLMGQSSKKYSFTYVQSRQFMRKALSYLDLLADEWNIDDLQALLLLYQIEIALRSQRSQKRLLSLACQTAVSLISRAPQPVTFEGVECDQYHSHHIKTLFWLCYRLDKDAAFHYGTPPMLTQDFSDLKMFGSHEAGTIFQNDHAPNTSNFYVSASYRLSTIKEKVCRLFFASQTANRSDNQILLNIRYLDVELEDWRSNLPPSLQPKLSSSSSKLLSTPDLNFRQSSQSLALQLDYHYALIMIHTSIRICKNTIPGTGDMPEDLHQVVHSSINLSLEAARSTLNTIRNALQSMGENSLQCVINYIPIAVMALFLNVIIHPFDPQAQPDLGHLMTTVSVLQSIDLSGVVDEKLEELRALRDFLMDLVRFGNDAIWKAKREA